MELVNALCPLNKGKSFFCLEASATLSPSSSSLKALYSLCLYGKVVAPMVVDAKALTEVVTSRWLKKVTVFSLAEESSMFNCFKLGFESKEDSEWALEQGPWSFKGYTFALRKWMPSVEGPSLVEYLRLWVEIHNLPQEYFSVANGTLLGATIGKVCLVEFEEDNPASWNLFLRVQVDFNIENPLVSGCFFDLASGVKRWIQFKYEKIGIFCYFCGRLGHQRKGCSLSTLVTMANLDDIPFPMYGPWLSTASRYHDVFSSAVLKPSVGVDSVSPVVALESAGPSSLPRPDGDRLEKVGSRREVTVTSRGLPGNGPVMQRKKWTPKKVTTEREFVRGISGFGKKMNRNLNFGKRPPETFPRIEPLTMGDNVSNPLGISIPNKEDVSLKSVPPFAIKENLSFLVGREVEAIQVMLLDGPSGPPGPKHICVQKEKKGSDMGCGPDGKVNGGPGCLNSKEVGPGGSLIDSNNPKAFFEGVFEEGGCAIPRPITEVGVDGGPPHLSVGHESGGINVVAHQDSCIGSLAVPSCDEGQALSKLFKAQEELLYDLKHFGKLDLYEIKSLGGDIGVLTTSETNERTTPFKKRKFEGSASLCTRPHKTIRTHPDVVRDFPWDTKEKDRESKEL
ncbi:hypothetical protein G4B88_010358 [Cannabis sativa]|uniref:CCHC-type domain-containing protein n=1 Tax=Cannabis sativa TaxID=3483 RepID=A0A7J6I6H5_CANSA|nr:hypothetical protein G4B88_010358 [Cannabis sativa]